MLAVLLLTGLVLVGNAVNHGLTPAEIAEFKPINADKIEQNTLVKGVVNITDGGGSYYTVYTNGVPSHSNVMWPRPEEVRPIYLNVTHAAINIPKTPKLRDNPMMCTPFGIVGVARGGVMIYNAYTPRKYCPIANVVEAFDQCMGHPDPDGGYHYHGHSSCNRMEVCGQESKLFGVALDGIPIYGPFDENGKQLVQTDLDICGGRIGSDGRYKYHITGDPPFLLNCFRGELHKELLNTDYPTHTARNAGFTCSCPLADEGFPECHQDAWCEDEPGKYTAEELAAYEAAFRAQKPPNKPIICNWNVTEGDFAECIDVMTSNYTPGFKQTRRYSMTKLIGCCPQGKDCGETCVDNAKCFVEERPGMFLVTDVVSRGTAQRVGISCMIMGLLMLF